jgi:23S rRNA pseudouridine1911/1915/1917 synthase
MHRLGRWTSGVVVFARSSAAASALAAAWREGRVVKRYLALASGRPRQRSFEVDVPIGPVPYAPLGRLYAASTEGKPARSRVRLLEQRERSFLAEVVIETGRPHQIRIHLAAAGHPLVGDPLYVTGGLPAPGGSALPGDPGYRLHAASVELDHPIDGRSLRVDCVAPRVLGPLSPEGSTGDFTP